MIIVTLFSSCIQKTVNNNLKLLENTISSTILLSKCFQSETPGGGNGLSRRLKQMHKKKKNTITAQRRGDIRAGGRNTTKSRDFTQQRVAGLELQHYTQTDAAGRPTGWAGWSNWGWKRNLSWSETRLHLQPPPCSIHLQPPPAAP